jgi:peptide/nickel transport system permease protein
MTPGGAVAAAGPWMRAARRLRGDRVGLIFVALLAVVVLLCLCAPLYAAAIAGTGPIENHITDTIRDGGRTVDVVAPDGTPIGPTWRAEYFLGADQNGRDLAVRLLYGTRNSLAIGAGAALISIALGAACGLLAGYAGGRADAAVMRMLDVIWSFPVLLAGIAVATVLTLQDARFASKLTTVLLIGVVTVPYAARPVRAQVRSLRHQSFVDAAILSGAGAGRVMARELLPNLAFGLIALFSVMLANAIVLEAGLSFLGAGVRPPEPSLGGLLREGVGRFTISPHLLVVPALALTVTVLVVNLVGDVVRRALDPNAVIAGPRP